jgi:hypothetical protein
MSSVSSVTKESTNELDVRSSIPGSDRTFSPRHLVQTGSGTNPVPCTCKLFSILFLNQFSYWPVGEFLYEV